MVFKKNTAQVTSNIWKLEKFVIAPFVFTLMPNGFSERNAISTSYYIWGSFASAALWLCEDI